jgi:DNA-binding PadR family transcriptional regulator
MKKPLLYVLLSLAESERYGSAIAEDVLKLSNGKTRLWPATLYGSLETLAQEGRIRELDEQEQPSGGAGRGRERFYQITPAGRRALAGEADAMESVVQLARSRMAKDGANA